MKFCAISNIICIESERQIAKRDKQGNASCKEALRQAIDEAKAHCTDRAEFQQYLQHNFGVNMTRNTGKTVSFIHPAVRSIYSVRLIRHNIYGHDAHKH